MAGPLQELAEEIRAINRANGWNVTHDTDFHANPPYKLMAVQALIGSEVSEGLEAIRHNDLDNYLEEQADTLIRVLDAVGAFTYDFDAIVRAKLEKNKGRGFRHGGKRA